MSIDHLLTEYELGSLTMRNRFVMSPMTREQSPDGIPKLQVADYYRRRAASVGLVITEGTYIPEQSAGVSNDVPHLYGDSALASWSSVVEAVHSVGGAIAPQLWHRGPARREGAPPYPEAPVISPSGIDLDGNPYGETIDASTKDRLIEAYVGAALNAQSIGFDGVELHGGHGFLLDSFLWTRTNQRQDSYGGDPASRARFATEVVAAIRAATKPGFPIIFRFSQWKLNDYEARIAETPQELEQLLTPIANAGVSAWDVSARRHWNPAFVGYPDSLATWTRRVTGVTTIAVGSVGLDEGPDALFEGPGLEELDAAVARDEFQLVGVGRSLLSDPDWVVKVSQGNFEEIRAYRKEHELEYF